MAARRAGDRGRGSSSGSSRSCDGGAAACRRPACPCDRRAGRPSAARRPVARRACWRTGDVEMLLGEVHGTECSPQRKTILTKPAATPLHCEPRKTGWGRAGRRGGGGRLWEGLSMIRAMIGTVAVLAGFAVVERSVDASTGRRDPVGGQSRGAAAAGATPWRRARHRRRMRRRWERFGIATRSAWPAARAGGACRDCWWRADRWLGAGGPALGRGRGGPVRSTACGRWAGRSRCPMAAAGRFRILGCHGPGCTSSAPARRRLDRRTPVVKVRSSGR